MTIIAAVIDGRSAVIACDSLGSNGWSKSVYGSKLVRLRNDLVVGISGSYLLARWLREGGAEEALREPGAAALDKLWAAWRVWAKAQGCGHTDPSGDHNIPATVLAAMPGQLFELQSDGSVLRAAFPYAAVGSGASVALGALAAARLARLDVWASAPLAVHAAIRHVPSCGGDVHVQCVNPMEVDRGEG
jgi:20S proteasome alpha/beta subunit